MKREIPLTIEQSGAVFERLEDLPIVLIGGQALNYWCSLYVSSTPELAGRVFTSKDVDFQGTAEDMMTAAARLSAFESSFGPAFVRKTSVERWTTSKPCSASARRKAR